jgi:putative DNA primase/helicase
MLIPFTERIPEDERDDELGDKLRGEGSGILNWALRGLRDWRARGLSAPEAVRAATSTYRQEQDQVGRWFAEACVAQTGGWIKAGGAYRDYKTWCEDSGERPASQTAFGEEIERRGVHKTRKNDGWRYLGYRWRDAKGDAETDDE